MTDAVEASGRTVDEAIDAALDLLDAREDEVEIQILSEGDEGDDPLRRTGQARVLVRFRDERSEEDHLVERAAMAEERDRMRRVDPEDAKAQADAVHGFLEGLTQTMALSADIQVRATSYGVEAELHGEDLALLIGRHGATLAGLQELCRAVAQRTGSGRASVTVDVEGYLVRRSESLERMARSAAAKARKSKRPVEMEPMNARDRKIVHDALTDFGGVRTQSEGEEPNRRIVIRPL